jgi:iron complex transport system ATP-binding protein
MSHLLACKQVSFSYQEAVLKNINASFGAGEFVGLIGPNGVGKTTLLSLLMGTLKAEKGDVLLYESSISDCIRRDIAQKISFVPQDTHMSYPFLVREVVAMGRNPYLGRFEVEHQHDLDAVENALSQTDLTNMADRSVTELSGGERQRVMIARAIAQETPIILLDEATANLDIAHQLDILNLLQKLKEQGRLIIASLHDLAMASRFCDRLLLLHEGDVVKDGKPADVLTTDNMKRYFGVEVDIVKHAVTGTLTMVPLNLVKG